MEKGASLADGAGRLLALLILATTVSCARVESKSLPPPRPARTATRETLDGIRTVLDFGEPLTEADKALLFETLANGGHTDQHTAALCLATAAKGGQVSRTQVLDLIEKEAIKAEPGQATLFALDAAAVLDLATLSEETARRDYDAWAQKKKDPARLDEDERRTVSAFLKQRIATSRRLAARILVQKRSLRPEERDWALGQIKQQASQTTGEEATYWEFVARVVSARS